MTRQELKEVFGMDTWTELYQFLKVYGHTEKERVKIAEPEHRAATPGRPRTWDLSVDSLKAKVFDELYPRLPLADSVLVVQEIVAHCVGNPKAAQDIFTFLNNLPTRSK